MSTPERAPGERVGLGEQPAWNLAQLVSDLRSVRSGGDLPHDGDRRRARPARDAVVALVRDLRAALFPTHFGLSDFTNSSVDFYVGSALDASLCALQEQVRRSLAYSAGDDESESQLTTQRAHAIMGEFATRLPKVRAALEKDIRAAYEGDPAAKSRAEVLFCYPGVTAITHHRLAHELYRLGVPLLARVIAESSHAGTGIDIHPGANIGESFFIDHGTGVVIGETSVIGSRVRLYQGVTLGARNFPVDESHVAIKGLARHPIIEDDVVIYAGATILGRVTIGAGSTIGGNVWLTHSVPAGSRVTQAKTRSGETFDDGAGI